MYMEFFDKLSWNPDCELPSSDVRCHLTLHRISELSCYLFGTISISYMKSLTA